VTKVDLVFEEATEADIPELTRVLTRAFDDDSRRHPYQKVVDGAVAK